MHGLGFDHLLNPASLTREVALKLLGFRLQERGLEHIGGVFSWPTKFLSSQARVVAVAEILVHLFWAQFLARSNYRIESMTMELGTDHPYQLAFFLKGTEREEQLQKLRQTGDGLLMTHFLLRSKEGLSVGFIELKLRVTAQRLLE